MGHSLCHKLRPRSWRYKAQALSLLCLLRWEDRVEVYGEPMPFRNLEWKGLARSWPMNFNRPVYASLRSTPEAHRLQCGQRPIPVKIQPLSEPQLKPPAHSYD